MPSYRMRWAVWNARSLIRILENKFRALAAWGFSTCNAYDVIELLWSFDNINDAASLARTTVPSATTAV